MRRLLTVVLIGLLQTSLFGADLRISSREWTSMSGQTASGPAMLGARFLTLNLEFGPVDVAITRLSKSDQVLLTSLRSHQTIQQIRALPGLQSLQVTLTDEGPQITAVSLVVVRQTAKQLAPLGKLQHLESAQLGVGDTGVAALVHLQGLENLKSLYVLKQVPAYKQTFLSPDELQVIEKMTQLRQFAGRVNDEGAKSLGKLTNLEHLKLDLSPLGTAGVAALTDLKKLQTLKLKHTRINDGSLKHVGKLRNLRQLEILYTRVNDDALRHLSQLKDLEILWLTSQVGGRGLKHLSKLKKLHTIVRNQNWQHDDVELEVLKDFHLRELYVRGGELSKEGLEILNQHRNLKKLTLHSGDLSDPVLKNISELAQLESLMLSIRLDGAGLSHLSGLTRLQSLRLMSHRRFDDQHLAILSKMPQLRELELTCVPRGDEPYGDGLAVLAKLTKLEKLIVPGDYLSDSGWRHLGTATTLKKLYIGGGVSDEEFQRLAGLTNLEELSIKTNRLTDKSARQLARLSKLRMLDLSGGALTDQTMESLQTLSNLRALDVSETRITSAGVSKLQQRLPFCVVRFGRVDRF